LPATAPRLLAGRFLSPGLLHTPATQDRGRSGILPPGRDICIVKRNGARCTPDAQGAARADRFRPRTFRTHEGQSVIKGSLRTALRRLRAPRHRPQQATQPLDLGRGLGQLGAQSGDLRVAQIGHLVFVHAGRHAPNPSAAVSPLLTAPCAFCRQPARELALPPAAWRCRRLKRRRSHSPRRRCHVLLLHGLYARRPSALHLQDPGRADKTSPVAVLPTPPPANPVIAVPAPA